MRTLNMQCALMLIFLAFLIPIRDFDEKILKESSQNNVVGNAVVQKTPNELIYKEIAFSLSS